jgi:hypothetical protein
MLCRPEEFRMNIIFEAFREIRDALDRYEQAVSETDCTDSTKQTYILHAQHFVRWLNDDFEPGRTLDGRH